MIIHLSPHSANRPENEEAKIPRVLFKDKRLSYAAIALYIHILSAPDGEGWEITSPVEIKALQALSDFGFLDFDPTPEGYNDGVYVSLYFDPSEQRPKL